MRSNCEGKVSRLVRRSLRLAFLPGVLALLALALAGLAACAPEDVESLALDKPSAAPVCRDGDQTTGQKYFSGLFQACVDVLFLLNANDSGRSHIILP